MNDIIIRKVKQEDINDIFELSNKDYVRRYSFNKRKIEWEDHVNWFNRIIEDKNVAFYVISDKDDHFLGQVRFNINNNSAIISISLSELIVGKGFSKMILRQSVDKLFRENNAIDEIIAFVSEDNIASVKLFTSSNFRYKSKDNGIIKFTLEKGTLYDYK